MSPTGALPAVASGVRAPALGTESPALWASPGHPWTQTPGPPPRRGGSRLVGKDGNSTGQGMEEGEASVAPGLVTGQGAASTAPGTTHGYPSGPLNGSLGAPGPLSRNSSTEPPLWPGPTQGPTDHIAWHTRPPTWDTALAALGPTGPQSSDPGPSSSPDLPSVPTPESSKLPACGECPGDTWPED